MPSVLLLNPNTSTQTTQMMVQLVQAQLPAGFTVHGMTATQGVPMITNEAQLAVAAQQVVDCWLRAQQKGPWHGVVLACFADPALHWLRSATGVPTVGIGEAAMRAASHSRQPFGIATTTPDLEAVMHAQAQQLGLGQLYTGARYTQGNPLQLVAHASALQQQLRQAVHQCVDVDGARSVVIGGGPLGQAAHVLAHSMDVPLIAPLDAAAQWLHNALSAQVH